MNNAELLPPQTMNPEDVANRPPIAEVAHVGSAIMHQEVAVDGIDQAMLDGDIEILEAQANGVDARREDTGRIHDLEKAYEEASVQNEIFNVYDEAAKENVLRDWESAIQEDEERTAAKEAEANAEAEKQQKLAAAKSADEQPEGEAFRGNPLLNEQLNEREQANAALERAGYQEVIPPTGQVRRDYETGNLIITDGDSIKVLDPRSNKPDITEYKFDSDSNTLAINTKGIGMIAKVGEYTPDATPRYTGKVITLPPAVAKLVGAKTATPLDGAK
jgi:hypothetical protein